MSDIQQEHVQTVRNAWVNALRAEVLRADVPELPRIAAVGMWIATYADADGSRAFPNRKTLAHLAGCSQETVTRAVKVLMAVGLLTRKRRPNASAVYQLIVPVERPDWAAHIHLYANTRQRRHRAEQKQRECEQPRTASADAFRTASPSNVPDSVPVKLSGQRPRTPSESPDSVPGRPRTASPDAFRTASPSNAYQYPPTYGRDPDRDQEMADHSHQPQQRAGTRSENEGPPTAQPLRAIDGDGHGAGGDRQPPLLGPVPGGPGPHLAAARHRPEERPQATYSEVLAAIDTHGQAAAITRYGGRLVTGALATRRSRTGT